MNTTVKSSELRQGMTVLTHGMRVLLDRPANIGHHAGTVYSFDGLITNTAEVNEEGFVPASFRPDNRWTVQGNDLASWVIEN